MNVKVTGVPMRTRRMSTSVDPRVGQLAATTVPKRSVGIQTLMYESSTSPQRPWSSLTLETRSHPWVPAWQDIHSTRVPITMGRLWMARYHHNAQEMHCAL